MVKRAMNKPVNKDNPTNLSWLPDLIPSGGDCSLYLDCLFKWVSGDVQEHYVLRDRATAVHLLWPAACLFHLFHSMFKPMSKTKLYGGFTLLGVNSRRMLLLLRAAPEQQISHPSAAVYLTKTVLKHDWHFNG